MAQLLNSGAGTLPAWVTDSFPIIRMVLMVFIAVSALLIIVTILASPANVGSGSNAITGASESFYTKNKSKNNQGRLKLAIIVCASCIAFSSVLYFISYAIYPAV